jgi:hypothetical protein
LVLEIEAPGNGAGGFDVGGRDNKLPSKQKFGTILLILFVIPLKLIVSNGNIFLADGIPRDLTSKPNS